MTTGVSRPTTFKGRGNGRGGVRWWRHWPLAQLIKVGQVHRWRASGSSWLIRRSRTHIACIDAPSNPVINSAGGAGVFSTVTAASTFSSVIPADFVLRIIWRESGDHTERATGVQDAGGCHLAV